MRLLYKVVAVVCASGWMLYFMFYHLTSSHQQIVHVSQWLTETSDRKGAAMSYPSFQKTTWPSDANIQAGSSAKKDSQEKLEPKESFVKNNGFTQEDSPQTLTLESKENLLKNNGFIQKDSPQKNTLKSQEGFVRNKGFVRKINATKQQNESTEIGLKDAKNIPGILPHMASAINNPGVIYGFSQLPPASISLVNSSSPVNSVHLTPVSSVSPVNAIPPLQSPLDLSDPSLEKDLITFLEKLQNQETPLLHSEALQSLKNRESPSLPGKLLEALQTQFVQLSSSNQNVLPTSQSQESPLLPGNVLQTGQTHNSPLLSNNVLQTLHSKESPLLPSNQNASQTLQNQENPLFTNVLQAAQISNKQNEVKSPKQTAPPSTTKISFTDACREIQQTFLPKYFRSMGFKATDGLGGPREPTPLTEMEERYLATPPLTEFSSIPDELRSKVTTLSHPDSHRVGSNVILRVDLYDQLGRRRTVGGDEVRVWLTRPADQGQGQGQGRYKVGQGHPLQNPGQGHATAGRVTDLGNGSYVGEVALRWEGPAVVKVSVTYPREFLRLVVELRHGLLSTRYVTALFSARVGGKAVKETTPCLPSQPIPGYASTCNLTEFNDWVPWFCGQPIIAGLRCEHHSVTGNSPFVTPLPVSEPAKKMINYLHRPGHRFRLVPNDIRILTQAGPPTPPLPPCWSRPPRESWELLSHGGTLRGGEWIPDHCALPAYSDSLVQQCLQNTTVLMFGDSNMLRMYEFLYKPLGLPQIQEKRMRPKYLEVPWLNSSLVFSRHALPFNPGWSGGLKTMSLAHALQTLPARHHYVIVLHYWLHLGFYPVHVFRERVRWVRRVMQDFLSVHPNAKFFIRGPHVVYDSRDHHANFGDKYGPWFIHILKQELRELYDRIWLLDFWPMTVASENVDLHPPRQTVQQMMRVLFGYACQASGGG